MSLQYRLAFYLLLLMLATACSKKDTTPPEITLKGSNLIIIPLNSHYIDAGATAADDLDGFLNIETTGTVDTNFAGTYYITYEAMDAAGNEARAIRTVVVYNEANNFNGDYNAYSVIGSDTSWFAASLTTSNTLNQRVWLVGYSNISSAVIYADLHHDTILVPHQIAQAGNPATTHAFTGNGFIKTINDHVVFEISFSDSVSGIIQTGTSKYSKLN